LLGNRQADPAASASAINREAEGLSDVFASFSQASSDVATDFATEI
jgi:hypothetical protein